MQINRQTYEEFFLLYADGELNTSERKVVEDFVVKNPDLANEFMLIQETVMHPDDSIIFENKELLFKNEDEERKVISMRWFRIAAAAILLITFSIIGWLFIGEKKSEQNPVAVVQKPEPVQPAEKPGNAVDETISKEAGNREEIISQSDKPGKADKTNQVVSLISEKNKINQPQNIKQAVDIEENTVESPQLAEEIQPGNDLPDPVLFNKDIVKSDPAEEIVDVDVAPREIGSEESSANNNAQYAQSLPEESDNDNLYFANTTISRKAKLRGVIRKATRYLDRVTSIQ